MKKFTLICLLALWISATTEAQNKKFADKVDLWFGWRYFHQPALGESEELNFFDYYMKDNEETQNYEATYEYLGFGWNKRWNLNWESDIRITLNSALELNSLFMRAIYFPKGKLGYFLSYYNYSQLMNSFTPYYDQKYPGYLSVIDDHNWWQWEMMDRTFSAGITLPLEFGVIQIRPALSAGFIVGPEFNKSVDLKEVKSNYRQRIDYEFIRKPHFYINPEIQLNLELCKKERSSFGLQFKADLVVSMRSIDYQMTSYEWTMDSPQKANIPGIDHYFFKREFDLGIYYKW